MAGADMPEKLGRADASCASTFHLRILHDAARELSSLTTPHQIGKAFLLTAMGGLGASSAFFVLAGTKGTLGGDNLVMHRGLPAGEGPKLELDSGQIWRQWLAKGDGDCLPGKPRVIIAEASQESALFPQGTKLLARWNQNGGLGGLLMLGPRLGNAVYGPEDQDFLLSLTDTLLGALSRACLTQRLAIMGQDLASRNALLNNRVFQQDTLIQALTEMSAMTSPEQLLESYLLSMAGTAGSGRAFVFLADRSGTIRNFSGRGVARTSLSGLDPVRFRQVVTSGLFTAGGRKSDWLDAPRDLAECGLPEDSPGIWFVAGEDAFGFVGLGPRLDGSSMDQSRRETLLAVTGAFLTSLRMVRLLETQRIRNDELAASNIELARLIEELTSAKGEIDGLQRAKARIKELVVQEMNRVSRATWMDFCLIVIVAAAIGFLFNWANPSGVDLVPFHWSRPASVAADVGTSRRLVESGQAVLIDARPQDSFKLKHIAGATNLPSALFDFMYGMRLAKLPLEKPVLVYGRTVSRLYDETVADLLKKRGHKDVRVLQGGMEAWKLAGGTLKP
jgi:rhodanese-related sulfurtransferase